MGGWVQWCLSFTIFIFKRPFFTLNLRFKLSIFTSSVFTPVIFQIIHFFTLKNPILQCFKKTGTPLYYRPIREFIVPHDEKSAAAACYGFHSDLKIATSAWRRRWRFLLPSGGEWRCEELNFLTSWIMKIISCQIR